MPVRFDDRLKTVLDQPAEDPHDRAVRWRQLIDLLSRLGAESDSPLFAASIEALRRDWSSIDEQLRAAAARSVASRPVPPVLLGLFASDKLTVCAPVLASASLSPSDWAVALENASEEVRRFVEALHPEIRTSEPGRPLGQAGDAAIAPSDPDHQPEQAASPPKPMAIGEMVTRIEEHLQKPQGGQAAIPHEPQPTDRSERIEPALFRWECDASGEIAWVEGAPRGPLVGRSIARLDDGADRAAEKAFSMRTPFKDATLTIESGGVLAGEWKISGVPAFEPADGRFAGYRGVAVRQGAAVPRSAHPAAVEDDASLRELVHEIRTPLNAIIGFAEIIEGQYLGPADRRYRERAQEIVAQARLLLDAVDDLDLAAKLRSAPADVGGCDLARLLQALEPAASERAGARGISLDIATNVARAGCSVEPSLAERLVRRFVFAAIDCAPAGARLAISLQAEGSRTGIVADAGPPGFAGTPGETLGLRLVKGLAAIVGGRLDASAGTLCLSLPGR